MYNPQDNTDAADVTSSILEILLQSFPTRVDIYDRVIADAVGVEWEEVEDEDGTTRTEYQDLPSGANLPDMISGILHWLSLEGLTHRGDSEWEDVILSAQGLKALRAYPSYLPSL